jgi:hypothetical protein
MMKGQEQVRQSLFGGGGGGDGLYGAPLQLSNTIDSANNIFLNKGQCTQSQHSTHYFFFDRFPTPHFIQFNSMTFICQQKQNKNKKKKKKKQRRHRCYRCLIIMQKHYNVIQYKETHCDQDINAFDDLCSFLTPYLPLITIIRGIYKYIHTLSFFTLLYYFIFLFY